MRKKLRRVTKSLIVAGIGIMGAQAAAWAGLGGNADSIVQDRVMMKSQARGVTSYQSYDMHVLSSGTSTIREYVTRSGQVFAVTWTGSAPPNLQQLLGNYSSRFQQATAEHAKASPGMHRVVSVHDSDFIVDSVVHMRAARGRAYIPSLVPSDVTVLALE